MTTRSKRRKEKDDEDVPFVKSLQFRTNRGNKIKNLLDKKEDESDSDDFWKNNKYFGNFNDVMNDSEESEDYSEEADIPDQFDEDFEETDESEEEDEGEEEEGKTTRRGKSNKSKLPAKIAQPTSSIQVTKKAPENIKKFIDKNEKKSKMKPAIAALKKKQQTKQASKQAVAPKRELRSVTFAMDTPEKPEKSEKPEKVEKVVDMKPPGKGPEKKVPEIKTLEKKPPEKKTPEKKTPEKKASEIKPPEPLQPMTTRHKERKVYTELEKSVLKLPTPVKAPAKSNSNQKIKTTTTPKVKPTKPTKTALKATVKATKGTKTIPVKQPPVETPKKKGNYIHDYYSQEELMKEAALTEILNKKSLESLLQLETDKKDSYLVMRRTKIEDSKVTYISKKVDDKEQGSLIISDKEAYQAYFGNVLSSKTKLTKRSSFEINENDEPRDQVEAIRKKIFLTNCEYKLAELDKSIDKMTAEEEHIDHTLNILRSILEKKQQFFEKF